MTQTRYNLDRYRTGLQACDEILKLQYISEDIEITHIQNYILVKHCIQIAREEVRAGNSIYYYYRAKCKNLGSLYLHSKYISFKQKLGWIILEYVPFLLKIV